MLLAKVFKYVFGVQAAARRHPKQSVPSSPGTLKAVEPRKRHAGARDLAVCEGAQDTLAHVTWLSVTSPFPTCAPSRNQFSHCLESEAFSAARASARRLKWPSTGQCKQASRPSPTPCESPICTGRRARPPIGWAKPPAAAASRHPGGPRALKRRQALWKNALRR